MVSLMISSSSSFAFIQFLRSIFNFFASSNRVALFISYYFFVTQGRLQKSFKPPFLHLKKSIIMTQHVVLIVFCIGVFTLFNNYLRMIIFNLFVDIINLEHNLCIAIYIIRNILTMKICLYAFFPRFQFSIDVPVPSFYQICRHFLK